MWISQLCCVLFSAAARWFFTCYDCSGTLSGIISSVVTLHMGQKGTEYGNFDKKVHNSPTTGVKALHKTTSSNFYVLSSNLALTGNYLQNRRLETRPAQVTKSPWVSIPKDRAALRISMKCKGKANSSQLKWPLNTKPIAGKGAVWWFGILWVSARCHRASRPQHCHGTTQIPAPHTSQGSHTSWSRDSWVWCCRNTYGQNHRGITRQNCRNHSQEPAHLPW